MLHHAGDRWWSASDNLTWGTRDGCQVTISFTAPLVPFARRMQLPGLFRGNICAREKQWQRRRRTWHGQEKSPHFHVSGRSGDTLGRVVDEIGKDEQLRTLQQPTLTVVRCKLAYVCDASTIVIHMTPCPTMPLNIPSSHRSYHSRLSWPRSCHCRRSGHQSPT